MFSRIGERLVSCWPDIVFLFFLFCWTNRVSMRTLVHIVWAISLSALIVLILVRRYHEKITLFLKDHNFLSFFFPINFYVFFTLLSFFLLACVLLTVFLFIFSPPLSDGWPGQAAFRNCRDYLSFFIFFVLFLLGRIRPTNKTVFVSREGIHAIFLGSVHVPAGVFRIFAVVSR